MTLEFEVDVDYLTDGGIKDMPTWVKLNDEDGGHASTVYVKSSSYWHVVDDNAKLRELVRDMWRFTGTACKKYPRLFDPAAQGGQTVQLNMIDAFEQRMRELGVEVDE